VSADPTWTILAVLDWTRAHFESKGLDNPRLDAEVILAHALKMQRVMLYAKHDQPLTPDERALIRGLVGRRARGEPIAQILGEREFYGMSFEITPDVLVPRPDTESLVEAATDVLRRAAEPATVADVGTGTGCVAIAIAKALPAARVLAYEKSMAALAVARRNVSRHALEARVTMIESDLLAAHAQSEKLDVVVANLPYIPSADIAHLARDVREFEPHSALDGGLDGLELIRRLIHDARDHLRREGAIVLEIGHDQGARVADILQRAGYRDLRIHRDLGDRERVVQAMWPGSSIPR
jgi:release factor glutamine methyltransferase